jgi:hypothetical protein
MKSIKRNSSQNFPIKLNYNKTNDSLYSYRGGKSSSNLQKINVNKNKYYLEESKNSLSMSKNSKNTSYLFSEQNIKNQNKKNDTSGASINSYNKNKYNFQLFIDNIGNTNKYCNNNTNYYSYKTKVNDSYNSNFFWKDNSTNSYNNKFKCNSSLNSYNYKNINSIFSFKRINANDKTIFNKKQIYQKPKNERTLSSYSMAVTDYNSNKSKDNLFIKSYNNCEINYNNNNNKYNNNKKYKKNSNYLAKRFNDISRCINSAIINEGNCLYKHDAKNNINYYEERRTNIDYSKLNLYSPKENKDINYIQKDNHYIKRNRIKMKSDIISNKVNDNIDLSAEKKYKTNSDNSFIYIRKNSSSKRLLNKTDINQSSFSNNNNINNYSVKEGRIRVNLKQRSILENAYYVQNKVILIQKNYRMHLGRLKRYILITVKKIIEGINKLYFIFYKNYCRRFIFILNNAYIKSIDINIKTAKIIPKYNRINTNYNYSRSKYSYFTNIPHKTAITDFKEDFKENFNYNRNSCNTKKYLYNSKLKNTDSNINRIKKDMDLIRNLKNQIVNKLNLLKK